MSHKLSTICYRRVNNTLNIPLAGVSFLIETFWRGEHHKIRLNRAWLQKLWWVSSSYPLHNVFQCVLLTVVAPVRTTWLTLNKSLLYSHKRSHNRRWLACIWAPAIAKWTMKHAPLWFAFFAIIWLLFAVWLILFNLFMLHVEQIGSLLPCFMCMSLHCTRFLRTFPLLPNKVLETAVSDQNTSDEQIWWIRKGGSIKCARKKICKFNWWSRCAPYSAIEQHHAAMYFDRQCEKLRSQTLTDEIP